MTKQEEIREGIKSKIGDKLHDHAYYRRWDDVATCDLISKADAITTVVLKYLQSQDVVIKVERELPNCDKYSHINFGQEGDNWLYDKELMSKTCPMVGRVVVEPLIEE